MQYLSHSATLIPFSSCSHGDALLWVPKIAFYRICASPTPYCQALDNNECTERKNVLRLLPSLTDVRIFQRTLLQDACSSTLTFPLHVHWNVLGVVTSLATRTDSSLVLASRAYGYLLYFGS